MFIPSTSWDDEPAHLITKKTMEEVPPHKRISVCKRPNDEGNVLKKRRRSVENLMFQPLSVPRPFANENKENDSSNISRPCILLQGNSLPVSRRPLPVDLPKMQPIHTTRAVSHDESTAFSSTKTGAESIIAVSKAIPIVTGPSTCVNSPVSEPVPKKRRATSSSKQLGRSAPDKSISSASGNFVYQDLKQKGGTKATKGAEALRRRIKRTKNERWREANGIRRRGKRAANFRREQLSKEMSHEKNLMDAVTDESLREMFSVGVERSLIDEIVESGVRNPEPNDPLASPSFPCVTPSEAELKEFLETEFGHSSFRLGQVEAIKAALSGKRSLIVLPTGTGKSLCYQFPSVYMRKKMGLHALTIVVSPLIALMDDQLKLLPRTCRGAAIHSNLSPTQTSIVYSLIQRGQIDILFVAPERLLMYSMRDVLSRVFLVALDEAHCLSEWSHSFRPAYLSIPKIVDQEIKPHSLLALTATATIQTVDSLQSCLSIDSVVRADGVGTDSSSTNLVQRENLELFARRSPAPTVDFLEFVSSPEMKGVGPIIIYVQYKWQTEQVSQVIRERGLGTAEGYHGGLSAIERKEIHNKFINNELRFVVATIAFGMGIDKRNVRSVIHLTLPKSIENYVQETGRCSRDGKPGFCRCYFNAEDYARIRNKSLVDAIRVDGVREVVRSLFIKTDGIDSIEIGNSTMISVPEKLDNVINKQHMSLVLSLIETEQKAVVHHGFPRVLKLRFFSTTIQELASIDPVVDVLYRSPHKPKAGQETVSESGGVVTVDLLSAIGKLPNLTPPQFMHQLGITAKAQKFTVAKSEWSHFVLVKTHQDDFNMDELIKKCFDVAITSHSLELNRLDASFALMSRIAAESMDDPLVGHKLIQQYFEAEARMKSGDDLVPSVLEGANQSIKNSVLREINNIRGN